MLWETGTCDILHKPYVNDTGRGEVEVLPAMADKDPIQGWEWRKIEYICVTYCAPSFCCPFSISLSSFTDCLFISSTFRSRDSNSLSRCSKRWLSDETWKMIETSVKKIQRRKTLYSQKIKNNKGHRTTSTESFFIKRKIERAFSTSNDFDTISPPFRTTKDFRLVDYNNVKTSETDVCPSLFICLVIFFDSSAKNHKVGKRLCNRRKEKTNE